jgi:vancomycin permeability regulator SanA
MFLWPLRIAFKVLSLLLSVVIVYYVVTGVQVWLTSTKQVDAPAQAIVVLGAAEYNGWPSPDLAARLQHALILYHDKDAGSFVLTGGKEPGDTYTEAEAEDRWLAYYKVPQTAVLAEVGGRDTYQSLADAAKVLHGLNITKVLMVSDPFHEDQICAIASSLGLHPLPSPTHTSPIKGTATIGYFAKEAAVVGIGRIIGWHHFEQLHNLVS